jgi:3-phosphoshikimate 1-carboxyvinyltransferase
MSSVSGRPDEPTVIAPLPETVRIAGRTPLIATLRVPGDKSVSHRALLLSALAIGPSRVRGLSAGADVAHTAAAVLALGAGLTRLDEDTVEVTGAALHEPAGVIDTGNSGTGIRLLAGLVAGLPGLTVLQGDASIAQRPMDRIAAPLRLMGAQVDGREDGRYPPLAIRGGHLHGIDYTAPVASAQVKSAILLAGLAADGPTVVREPVGSRAHTEEMLAARGVDISVEGSTVLLHPSPVHARDETVPGDPSQAAFWLVAAAAIPGSDVTVSGLYLGPARGGFLDVLRRMGAAVSVEPDPDGGFAVRVVGGSLLGTDITPDEIAGLVDEIPALAVAAALAEGPTTVRGAAELRVKESDRVATTAGMLRAFGVAVEELPDGLVITGQAALHPGTVDSHGDHRIAMAAAVAALAADGTSTIGGFSAVSTSYPSFLADLERCAAGAVQR